MVEINRQSVERFKRRISPGLYFFFTKTHPTTLYSLLDVQVGKHLVQKSNASV